MTDWEIANSVPPTSDSCQKEIDTIKEWCEGKIKHIMVNRDGALCVVGWDKIVQILFFHQAYHLCSPQYLKKSSTCSILPGIGKPEHAASNV